MEELEVVCPDCGAVYGIKPEQAGKLLHCKCGRYLVAGGKHDEEPEGETAEVSGENEKPEPPKTPEPGYEPTQRLNVSDLMKQAKAASPQPETPAPPKDETPGYQRTERLNVADLKKAAGGGAAPDLKVKTPAGPNIPPPEKVEIGVKVQPPKPTVEEHATEPVSEPKAKPAPAAQQPDDKKKMMMIGGGATALIVLLALGYFAMRPSTGAEQAPQKSAAAKTAPPAPATANTAATAAAPANGGCGANPERMENGAQVSRSLLGSGMGKLEIENQMPTDISARLVNDSGLTIAWVYVQQGQSVKLGTVPLGTHKLLYEAGSDWDAQNLTFKCNNTFAEWDKPLEYSERRVDDRSFYGDKKVTIGKTKPPAITKDAFFRGHIGLGGPG